MIAPSQQVQFPSTSLRRSTQLAVERATTESAERPSPKSANFGQPRAHRSRQPREPLNRYSTSPTCGSAADPLAIPNPRERWCLVAGRAPAASWTCRPNGTTLIRSSVSQSLFGDSGSSRRSRLGRLGLAAVRPGETDMPEKQFSPARDRRRHHHRLLVVANLRRKSPSCRGGSTRTSVGNLPVEGLSHYRSHKWH